MAIRDPEAACYDSSVRRVEVPPSEEVRSDPTVLCYSREQRTLLPRVTLALELSSSEAGSALAPRAAADARARRGERRGVVRARGLRAVPLGLGIDARRGTRRAIVSHRAADRLGREIPYGGGSEPPATCEHLNIRYVHVAGCVSVRRACVKREARRLET